VTDLRSPLLVEQEVVHTGCCTAFTPLLPRSLIDRVCVRSDCRLGRMMRSCGLHNSQMGYGSFSENLQVELVGDRGSGVGGRGCLKGHLDGRGGRREVLGRLQKLPCASQGIEVIGDLRNCQERPTLGSGPAGTKGWLSLDFQKRFVAPKSLQLLRNLWIVRRHLAGNRTRKS
jgi:hypothetical protein